MDNSNAGTDVYMYGIQVATDPAYPIGDTNQPSTNNAVRPISNQVLPGAVGAYQLCNNCVGSNTFNMANIPIGVNMRITVKFRFGTIINGEPVRLTKQFQINPYYSRR